MVKKTNFSKEDHHRAIIDLKEQDFINAKNNVQNYNNKQ